jgi:hypothetical protein
MGIMLQELPPIGIAIPIGESAASTLGEAIVVWAVAIGSGRHCAKKLMKLIGLPKAGIKRCHMGVSPPALAAG